MSDIEDEFCKYWMKDHIIYSSHHNYDQSKIYDGFVAAWNYQQAKIDALMKALSIAEECLEKADKLIVQRLGITANIPAEALAKIKQIKTDL